MDSVKLLGTRAAAKMIGVSPNHLTVLVRAGKIRALNISAVERPVFRFESADVEAFKRSIVINGERAAS